MKKGDYLEAKQQKKKASKEAFILIVVFIIVFIALIFRFAIRTGTNQGFFSFMPTSQQAYQISNTFVRQHINTKGDVTFPDRDFQLSKNSDSIYVIKSFYTIQESNGHETKKEFTVTLKYNGGSISENRNWTMTALQQDK